MASAGGRWWHHFPGDGVPGGDHNEFPVPGADREGPGVSLLENAQHVDHRLAVSRPGRQRITTRLPTSARVSRTSSRYHMPVTCYQGRRPGLPGSRPGVHRRRPLVTECHPVPGPTSRGSPTMSGRWSGRYNSTAEHRSSIPVRGPSRGLNSASKDCWPVNQGQMSWYTGPGDTHRFHSVGVRDRPAMAHRYGTVSAV